MNNKLSVYIVTYNRAEYLRDSIKSVLEQTYYDFDLYILDNSSTDNTREIVAGFNDDRIHYICHEKNIGGFENIKFAYRHCDSEYMVIFHDDDVMRCDMLEKEYDIMRKDKECAIVSCYSGVLGEEKNKQGNSNEIKITCNIEGENGLLYNYLYNQKNLIFPSIMYRMSYINKHNICLNKEVGPCADVVFYLDVEKNGGKIFTIQEPLMYSRIHNGQDSSMNFGSMLIKLIEYFKNNEYYSRYLEEHIDGQRKYYKWFSRKAVIRVASGGISPDVGKQEIQRMSELLSYRKCDKVFVNLLITMERLLPALFKWVYRIVKRSK